jgi:hypothetical protein
MGRPLGFGMAACMSALAGCADGGTQRPVASSVGLVQQARCQWPAPARGPLAPRRTCEIRVASAGSWQSAEAPFVEVRSARGASARRRISCAASCPRSHDAATAIPISRPRQRTPGAATCPCGGADARAVTLAGPGDSGRVRCHGGPGRPGSFLCKLSDGGRSVPGPGASGPGTERSHHGHRHHE